LRELEDDECITPFPVEIEPCGLLAVTMNGGTKGAELLAVVDEAADDEAVAAAAGLYAL
jgi:hypothetical protein